MSTDRDYADKSWLREEPEEDSFQLIPPEIAGAIVVAVVLALVAADLMHLLSR